MKLAKKFLVAALALALLMSAVIFSAFAVEEEGAELEETKKLTRFENITDILEYYVNDEFYADNYEAEDWALNFEKVSNTQYTDNDKSFNRQADYTEEELSYNATQLKNAYYRDYVIATQQNPKDSDDRVLAVELPYQKQAWYLISGANKDTSWTDQLIVSYDIYFDDTVKGNLKYDTKVALTGKTSTASVLTFDFTPIKNGGEAKATYNSWNAKSGAFSSAVPVPDFIPETNVWYTVEIAFNTVADTFSCKIYADGAEEPVASVAQEITGAEGVWKFENRATFSANTTIPTCTEANHTAVPTHNCRANAYAKFYLDDIEVYEGSIVRDTANRAEITADTFADFARILADENSERIDRLNIANVIDQLWGNNAAGEPYLTDELKALLPNAIALKNEIIANEILLRANGIDTTQNYYKRSVYLPKVAEYLAKLPATYDELIALEGITEELANGVVTANEAYTLESALLVDIKNHSDGFLALMDSYDPNSRNYKHIRQIYLDAVSENYAQRDARYDGMPEAEAVFAGLEEKYLGIEADVADFLAKVKAMQEAAPLPVAGEEPTADFADLYNAYLAAYSLYYKYDEAAKINPNLDNSTYFVLDEAEQEINVLVDMIAYYEATAAEVLTKKAECDAFNAAALKAYMASDYKSIEAALEIADAAYDVINGDDEKYGLTGVAFELNYPGIADSIANYEYASKNFGVVIENSSAYTSAVKLIDPNASFNEFKAAILAAKELKAAGDNVGVEGVKEANELLDGYETAMNLLEINSKNLITYVTALDSAATLDSRKALILAATEAYENAAKDYVDENEMSVEAANTALLAAIDAYNADVAEINDALAAAMGLAQSVAGAVGGSVVAAG